MERVEFVRIRGAFIADVAGVLVDQLCQDGKGEAEVDCEKVRCACSVSFGDEVRLDVVRRVAQADRQHRQDDAVGSRQLMRRWVDTLKQDSACYGKNICGGNVKADAAVQKLIPENSRQG